MFVKQWKNITIFFLSILMFFYYLRTNYNVSYYDEAGYMNLSKAILENGLFSLISDLRTYLYPLVISIISIFTDGDPFVIKVVVSIFQYVIYSYTILKLAKYFGNYHNNNLAYYSVLCFGLLNPYFIHATTLLLTDMLASCFILLALSSLMFGDFGKKITYFQIFGYINASVMIRPSSLIFIPIVLLLLFVRNYMFKDVRIWTSILSFLALSVLFFPQLFNNVKYYNDWNPLLHANLYEFQSNLAASNLKYGTVVIPGEHPKLFYASPFVESMEAESIYSLIFTDFFAFLITYLSHLFGVLDWGYIQIYISNFYPPSRILGSLFLYVFWIVSFYGLASFLKSCKEKKEQKIGVFIALTLSTSFILYWAFLGTTIIESRFGYPLYLLMLFYFAYGVKRIVEYIQIHQRNATISMLKLSISILFSIGLVLVIFYLSFLMDYQTGRINWINWLGL
ncbi:hypothetical protein [Paenibacillus amylolyticus]|uniref:hypothetical protein n=1 Tax=Paenibacillus amylolyticus TaxID=1451 RepID=UPI003D98AF5F